MAAKAGDKEVMSSNKRQKTEEGEVVIVYKQGMRVPKNVTKVIFDASVTEIPDGSYYDAEGVFSHCTNLMEVVFNAGLQKIGYCAFYECSSLTIVNVPSTVTEVRKSAFFGCTNLREVVLNGGLQKIGYNAFAECVSLNVIKLPSTTIEIGVCAFRGCTKLSTIVLNEGLQKIGRSAFNECTSLAIIKLSSTVTAIGEHAFSDCTHLKEVILNEGLEKVCASAFWGCTSLPIIKLPSTVTEVEPCAFYGCTNLREVVLHEGLQEIFFNAFGECESLEYVKFATISNRAKNLIDTGITEIEDEITIYQHFEWRGDELLVSSAAINDEHWGTIRRNLDQLLACISHYELKEATTIIELAMWKAKIEETGAATAKERSACRVAVLEVPGPAKDAILQYLEVEIGVNSDGNESDDSSQYSSSGDSSQYSDSSSEDDSDD